jgi:hypothetical protein
MLNVPVILSLSDKVCYFYIFFASQNLGKLFDDSAARLLLSGAILLGLLFRSAYITKME